MNTMMQGLLSASLSGSLMVLVFLALRYLLNGHISRTAAGGADGDTGQSSCYGNGRRKRCGGSFRDCRD